MLSSLIKTYTYCLGKFKENYQIGHLDLLLSCNIGVKRRFIIFKNINQKNICTIILRGGSFSWINLLRYNLVRSIKLLRNVIADCRFIFPGGCTEVKVYKLKSDY
mmetsp:Transcript_20380/g.28432  ORF Transcript_20380/g.28432 Transcript_20380/m.28432 type:complete len:105 (-) Transcript_20380:870-1184(-)